jgi:ribosomal RNA-processing protein 36
MHYVAEKKDFLMHARYDALAASGGKDAVRKAIEKKQKKLAQKEKRSRPFKRGEGHVQRGASPRKRALNSDSAPNFRRNTRRRLA